MTTLLRLNGHSYVVQQGILRKVVPEARAPYSEPQQLPAIPPAESGTIWVCPHGVAHRKVDAAPSSEGWFRAAVLAKWLGVEAQHIRSWARMGMLDAAVVRGTAVPLYRVLDPTKVKQASEEARGLQKKAGR